MADYLGMRIIKGALDYAYVVSCRPDLQAGVDAYLIANDRADLIIA